MALSSTRKKLDEYHLKILRELLSSPGNKYCFDCHQRGPTYVNVTIGSFVCTTCSGMLRGLPTPHRVKSITMATFQPEEMELIRSRGNEYCRKVWLGLYDSEMPTKDDQLIKDFMIAKYESKRYYLEPTLAIDKNNTNGFRTNSTSSSVSSISSPSSSSNSDSISQKSNQSCPSQPRPKSLPLNHQLFNSDLFSSTESFANFDNAPIFTTPSAAAPTGELNGFAKIENNNEEDKYAALKDLDSQMKTELEEKQRQQFQKQTNNNNNNNNWNNIADGNGWGAAFPCSALSEPNTPFANPFKEEAWPIYVTSNGVNPFVSAETDMWNGELNWHKTNGFSNKAANPFTLGAWPQVNGHHSNNPFL